MTDRLTKDRRSWNMSRIGSVNTNPEIVVRSALHRMGYRFRIHVKDLPGKPDVVLPRYKTVIFVHGCFWHRHENCREASKPKTNSQYWENKIARNIERDKKNSCDLTNLGWRVVVIWECELKKALEDNIQAIKSKLV